MMSEIRHFAFHVVLLPYLSGFMLLYFSYELSFRCIYLSNNFASILVTARALKEIKICCTLADFK